MSVGAEPKQEDFGIPSDLCLGAGRDSEILAYRAAMNLSLWLVVTAFVASALFFYHISQMAPENRPGLFIVLLVVIPTLVTIFLGEKFVKVVCLRFYTPAWWRELSEEIETFQAAHSRWARAKEDWEYRNLETQKGFWEKLRGIDFEEKLRRLFASRGCTVKTTSVTGDGGVDLLIQTAGGAYSCQCKGHSKPLSVGVIREIAGVCSRSGSKPVVFAVNGFTEPARKEAERLGVLLFDSLDYARFAQQKEIRLLKLPERKT